MSITRKMLTVSYLMAMFADVSPEHHRQPSKPKDPSLADEKRARHQAKLNRRAARALKETR